MNAETYGLNNPTSLLVALSKVFRGQQKIQEFSEEVKKLTDADKAWFKERFQIEFGVTVN